LVSDLLQAAARQILDERLSHSLNDHDRHCLLFLYGYEIVERLREVKGYGSLSASAYDLISLGLLPHKARAAGINVRVPYTPDSGSAAERAKNHPLFLADALYNAGDAEGVEDVLLWREELNKQWATPARNNWWPPHEYMAYVLTNRPSTLVHRYTYEPHTYLHWYTTKDIVDLIQRTSAGPFGLRTLQAVVNNNPSLEPEVHTALRKRCRDAAYSLLTAGRPDYSTLIESLRLVDPEDRPELLEDAGPRVALWLTLDSATTEQFIAGLSALAKNSSQDIRRQVLSELTRVPTVEELRAVRSNGLLRVIYDMPYTFIERLDEKAVDHVHALSFKIGASDFELMRGALLRRADRVEVASPPVRPGGNDINIFGGRWVGDSMIASRRRAPEMRQKLIDTCGSRDIAFLVLTKRTPNIDALLKTHPTVDRIEGARLPFET
jgi:hypothetical protein